MSKKQTKKLFAIITGLFLITQMAFVGSFNIPQAQAATYTFTEDFTTNIYKNSTSTTADWNTGEEKLLLDINYNINDWSSYLNNFNGPLKAIGNNNYIQMIGGGGGLESASLNQIPSGVFDAFEDKSDQLVSFNSNDGLNAMVIAIDWSSDWTYGANPYFLIAGGYFYGIGPKLNKVQAGLYTDLSSGLENLGISKVTDLACSNYECLIGGETGKIVKYDGNIFTDLSNNIDFNNDGVKVAWNGDYWLIGGTRYLPSESNDHIGKIYKYDGSTFTKITEDTMFVGGGPSIFDMAWNGNEWLIARGYSPISLYKYNGSAFENLSSQLSNFVSIHGDVISPTIYWTGNAWLIGGGTYFRHLIRYDGTYMTEIIDLFENFNGSSIEIIAPKYLTTFNPFFIGGGITNPKLNVVQDFGYNTLGGTAISKKINDTNDTISAATLTVTENQSSDAIITYYLSADGGFHWEQVGPGARHVFTNRGNDLRWKAELKTMSVNITPVIHELNIDYETTILPSITLQYPNGGETIEKGREYTITWGYSGTIPKVDISIYKASLGSGGVAYIAKNIDNTGSYLWNTIDPFVEVYSLLTLVAGDDYTICVRSSSDHSIGDSSDSSFSVIIVPLELTISLSSDSPEATSVEKGTTNYTFLKADLVAGDLEEDIKITSIAPVLFKNGTEANNELENIKLYEGATLLSDSYSGPFNNGVVVFSNLNWIIPRDSQKTLTIKADIPETTTADSMHIEVWGSTYMGSVGATSGSIVNATGRAVGKTMTIVSGVSPEIVSPNGGEKWVVGKTYDIKWDCPDGAEADVVDIFIKDKRESVEEMLIGSLIECSLGKYSWKVKNVSSGEDCFKIQLRHVAGAQPVIDESDNYFSVLTTATDIVSPTKSTFTASPILVMADGSSIANLIVVVRDENNNLLSSKIVTISSSRGSQDTINTIIGTTGSDGKAVFSVSSSVAGVSTYTATADGVTIAQTAQVTFITSDTCLPDGTLIKLPTDPKVYVIIDCKKKWIKTVEEFQQGGYNWSDIKEVNSPVIEALADYLETVAELLRAIGHYKVYRIIDGKQLWIPTVSAFNAQGLKWEDVQEVSQTEVNQYPRAKLLQATGDPKVYYITESGLKRHLINPQVFTSYNNKWEDIVQVTPAELNSYSDNILIKAQGDYKVYKIEDNKKRWIKTNEAFNRLNYDWSKIAPVNTTEINAYPIGTDIE